MSTLQKRAYSKMRRAILSGVIPAGSQIRQEELAAEFDVSRSSVRFAIQALANDGLVEIKDTRRSFVADVSLQEAEEMYDILAMLESYSAGLAAARATDSEITELYGLVDEMDKFLEDDLAYLDVNSKFHRKIHALSGNRVLNELIDRVVDFPHTLYLKLGRPTETVDANTEHRRLVDALAKADSSLSALEMKMHIETRRRESRDDWPDADAAR